MKRAHEDELCDCTHIRSAHDGGCEYLVALGETCDCKKFKLAEDQG